MNTIQATELRIGNFIGMNLEEYPNNFFTSLEIGETMKVYEGLITLKGANIKRVETSFMYVDDFEPIPLNEDWLVRLGFISNPYFDRYEKDSFHIEHDATQGYSQFWNSRAGVTFKTVHHLQNYYHALTGTELTLTDK